jgi:hypothetical protein
MDIKKYFYWATIKETPVENTTWDATNGLKYLMAYSGVRFYFVGESIQHV